MITAPHFKTINNRYLLFSKWLPTLQGISRTLNKDVAATATRFMQILQAEILGKTAAHCRSDRQSPTNLNSPRCHCQDVPNTASTTSGPSNATNINTCLKPETASNTFHQQVSHLTTHDTVSSLETPFSY